MPMRGFRGWARSSRGAWVVAILFFAVAVLNVAAGVWWLAALMAALGVLNLSRAVGRRRGDGAGI
jgi:hypothetical protein